jgi:hypothetical protein
MTNEQKPTNTINRSGEAKGINTTASRVVSISSFNYWQKNGHFLIEGKG